MDEGGSRNPFLRLFSKKKTDDEQKAEQEAEKNAEKSLGMCVVICYPFRLYAVFIVCCFHMES